MSERKQTVIFLVRHGQTDRFYSRDENIDGERVLTEMGEGQVERVGEYLRSFAPSVIYSSPIKRTMQSSIILKKVAQIDGEIIETDELFEVYNNERYMSLEKKLPAFLRSIATKHAGEQIVCVSHQDVIEGAMRGLGFGEEDFPCQMAELFRVVYADDIPVESIKLKPADGI